MADATTTHPTDQDLENFARDQLGERKKKRIIEHCRGCDPCADRLLEAARAHPGETPPLRLSRWNVISLVVMVAALIGVVVATVWLMRSLGERAAPELPPLQNLQEPEQAAPEPGDPRSQRRVPPGIPENRAPIRQSLSRSRAAPAARGRGPHPARRAPRAVRSPPR